MPSTISDEIKQLAHQHGLFTFLLFFTPLIPGIVEAHTKAYLHLFDALNFNLNTAETAIDLVFGQRGLKAYHQYLEDHPDCVLPGHIFTLLYQQTDLDAALKQMSLLFFDRHQRAFPFADSFRATIIQEIPRLFQVFSAPAYQEFRSHLIQKVASLMEIELALEPKIATLNTASALLAQATHQEDLFEQRQLNAQIDTLSARIKAELAGASTAAAQDFSLIPVTVTDPRVLTPSDIDTLKDVILHLAQSTSPEIEDLALKTLSSLKPKP